MPSSGHFTITLTDNIIPQTYLGNGSIVRFAGRVSWQRLSRYLLLKENSKPPESLVFIGEGGRLHRLTFWISEAHGFVYVRGKGRLILDGKEINLKEQNKKLSKYAEEYEKVKDKIINELKKELTTKKELAILTYLSGLTYYDLKDMVTKPEDLSEITLRIYRLLMEKVESYLHQRT